MKTGCQIKSLGEVASITAGQSAPQGDENFSDKGFPFIRAGSLEKLLSGCSSDQLIKIEEDKAKKHGLKLFSEGCVLFAKSGMSSMKDRVIVLKSSAYVVSHIAVIKPDEGLDSKYLAHWLSSFRPSRLIKDESYPSISLEAISNVEIPLPPLPIQKQIAEILEKADQAKQKRKEANRLTEQFLQSAFIEMFGDPEKNPKRWEVKRFEYVAQIIMGQSPHGNTYNYEGNGIPLLNGPAEFGKKYPIEVQWTTSPTKMCMVNDILFCVRGATAGKMNWADKDYCIGRGLAAIRSNKFSKIEVLYFFLKAKYSQFQSLGQGSTFINLSKDLISSIPFPLPPLSLQLQFAELVQKTETLKEKQKQTEIELDNLFNSLMQKAFRGELV